MKMKLLMCLKCGDVFSLSSEDKSCGCGESGGKYVDELNAEIRGDCKAIGFDNKKFVLAYQLQRIEDQYDADKDVCCEGIYFDAFFIPESAKSIKRIDK